MKYYGELKSKSDIIEVAIGLGFNGNKSGSIWQGDCPRHISSSGRCLTIYQDSQSFHCFHCKAHGDVINLVMMYRNMDHLTAVDYLADLCGMPHLGGQNLSADERARLEADYQEEKLVKEMLTEAAAFFHGEMDNYPQVKEHLTKHYGFSEEIIESQQIGFAPPPMEGHHSELEAHLESKPDFKGKSALTGLFSGSYDFFKGRIVFPYWKNGKVAYFKARASDLTPVDGYECFRDKDGNIKLGASGTPEYIKYMGLRTHDPSDDRKKLISRFVQNDTFLGEDSIRGHKEIIITEGVPDWVSAIDQGFAAISPGTTNFPEKEFPKLERLTRNAQTIYLINDNEDNQAGYEGALKTGVFLTKAGRNVFLVELPRPAGTTKIDLNEYLRDHSAEDLRKVMEGSKSVLEMLINALPGNFPKALPTIQSDIAPMLAGLEGGMQAHYADMLRKKTGTTKQAITSEIDLAVERLAAAKIAEKKEEPIDPEVVLKAQEIAQDPMLFKKRLDILNQAGVVGERNIMAMYFATLDSRLLPDNHVNPNVLATKNAGHQGSGKSFTLGMVLTIYPESCYHYITNGSGKSMYYTKEGFKHKALIVTEAFQFQSNNAGDSELVYTVRTLLSEGKIKYMTVVKNEDGFETILKELEGPTSFITTTIIDKLEPQLEDRLFTIHPDESFDQTRDIINLTGDQAAGLVMTLDKKTVDSWKAYHSSLKPVEVVIPFAPEIARYITQGRLPIATRRAFSRVLSVIKAIVCAYQYQRQTDDIGRVIAEICDYSMAVQIVKESFWETMGQQSNLALIRIDYVRENGPVQFKTMQAAWGVSGTAVSDFVKARVKDGTFQWCKADGREFFDPNELNKAKSSGKGFVKISDSYIPPDSLGLPTPLELTGDPEWAEGEKFSNLHDLQLKKRPEVSRGDKWVSRADLYTEGIGEPIESIHITPDKGLGVKVSTLYQEGKEVLEREEREDKRDIQPVSLTDDFLEDTKLDIFTAPGKCREGCKHYDKVTVNRETPEEYCMSQNKYELISIGTYCTNYESCKTEMSDKKLTFAI